VKRFMASILVLAVCVQGAEAGSSKTAVAKTPSKNVKVVGKAAASNEDKVAPVPAPVAAVATTAPTPDVLREKKYFYSSFGTRDPFRSLVSGEFEAKLQDLVDLRTVTLVGVLSEDDEHVAMVQDGSGFGYNLRPGDRVRNGTVVSVGKDALVARLNVFGQTTRVTLRLQREE